MKQRIPRWLKTSMIALFSAIIGAIGTSYINFTQQNRAVVETDFGILKNSSTELFQLLDAYSKRARLGEKVDDATATRFRLTLLKLYNEADSITKREPRVQPEFTAYAQSLIILRDAAADLHGPLDAKKFVEATSDYFEAEAKFTRKVSDLQRNYLKSLY